MAAPAWATDLTDIYLDGAATVTALGGGAAGLSNPEPDYYVQGGGTPTSISKQAWTNAIKGFIVDSGGTITIPTDGVIVAWGFYSAVASLAAKSAGGLRIIVGSATTAYWAYYVGGSDTLIFESWVPYVVDPNTATPDDTVGAPGTERWVGILANLPTVAGPTKGYPIAIDAIRVGRHTLTYTLGDGAPNYNTFALAEADANSIANRWGNIEFNKGAYFIQGFHSFGETGTAVDFRDQNKVIFIRDSGGNNETDDAVSTGYNRLEVLHASSNVDWTNITFQALGTRARGVFVHTAGTFDAVDCQFIDMDTFSLLSTSVMTGCIFRRCNAITAPGSTLTGSQVLLSTVAADASALVWDVADDPLGNLDDMTFEKGTADHHAITLGANLASGGLAEVTLSGITFTGFSATDGQNSSVILLADAGEDTDWTINTQGTSGVVSVKKTRAGDTFTIVANPVTLTITVVDLISGTPVENANVYIVAGDTGPLSPGTQIIKALTDVNGEVADTRTWASDQEFEGWARKASVPYKTGPVAGIISAADGANVTIQMILDE
jgi:hypothetical protein